MRVPGYGFGIAVSGGRDNPHFADGDPSIAISDVLKSGPAEDKLMINDRIISANGISLENVDYATAVQVLRDCSNSVNLLIKRKTTSPMAEPQTVRVTITRGKRKDDFGVVLGCHLYIKEVTNNNLVERDGTIHEGDYVLKINNTNAENLSLKEAKKLVESGKERLHLVLRRDPGRIPPGIENHHWSGIYEQSPIQNVPSPPSFSDIASARQQWSNQNLYVQPPTRGDYRPPPPPPERTDDKNNLTRSVNSTGRIRGPLMDISLSQLDQPATPLLANHRQTVSIDEDDAPPRPPPPRLDEFINTRGDIYDDDPLSRRSKVPLPDPRLITFQKDGSVGIRLTGGNEVGIFVTAVQPGSPASLQGLQPGDKILKVNDKDMRGITREEAVLFLLRIHDQVNLIVQHRKEDYDVIVANQKGDSFYIRTHFTFESNGKGELTFHVGEVFHVIDTLYNGVVGSWMVYRMGRNNQQIQKGIIPNKRRAEELFHEQQNQAKKDAASESRGSFFKRRSARRSKSLSKDHWEDVVFADGLSKFPSYEKVTLKHPGFVRPVVLFGPVGDIARDKLLKDYPDKYASPQLDNRLDDIPKSQKSSGIIRLSAIKEIIEKGKHAILDITPSAVDRLNYAQFYPIVIFMKAENKHMVKELRSRLAKSSHKSSKKLYDHSTKLEKLWSHVFTATVTLTSADMWYKKLRETIEKQQQQSIWISETKPQEAISDDFLFPMTSRLSYASSPESDLDLTTDARPLSLQECGSLSLVDRRLVKASSDPSIATQEDTGFNSAPPPYSPARPRQDHNIPSSLNSQQPHSRDSINSPRHRTSHDGRNEEYYSSRTALDHYSSLAMAEKRLSQVNGDINAHQSWPPEHREHPHLGHNPDYINTSKSSSLERSNKKPGTFDNSSYSSDSYNKYSGNQMSQSQDNRMKRDSYNSVSLSQSHQRIPSHDPYRYTRSTAQTQWAKPMTANGNIKQPPITNKYRHQDEKTHPPSPPPKPNIYATRLQDGRPVPPPKPMHYQPPRQWPQDDSNRSDMNFKRIPQELSSAGSRTSESMITSYIQNQTRRENSDFEGSSGVYGSRMYHPVEPPPRPVPPPVPEDPYQVHQKMSVGRRIYQDDTVRSGAPNHNYEMPMYAKGQGQSPSRPIAHVNGTTAYHHMPNSPSRRDQSYYSPGHHHSSPPPSSLLDLSNRENRGSAFELYKKPDSRSQPGLPLSLHINSEQPKSRSSSASSESCHNVVAIARGVYDDKGGVLMSEETGVSIIIPSGAIPKGTEQEIYFKVCQDSTMLPPLDKEKGETLLSPLVMCGPHGLQFNIPVELRLPHCAAVNPESWSFALKSSETPSGHPEEWQNTSLDSRDGGTFSRINDNFVSVLVDHF